MILRIRHLEFEGEPAEFRELVRPVIEYTEDAFAGLSEDMRAELFAQVVTTFKDLADRITNKVVKDLEGDEDESATGEGD